MLGRIALTNKLVSRNLGIDEKKVESVTKFFFKDLEKELHKCEHPYIFVKGLGTFSLSLKFIEKRIRSLHFYCRKQRQLEAIGVINPMREFFLEKMRGEIFYLFGMRRRLKLRKEENKKLKYGEIVDGD